MTKKLGMKITIADRMLLLIKNVAIKKPEVIIVPYTSTRLGLAEILDISPAHISRSAKYLIEKGLIEEVKANAVGVRKRVMTYFLTTKGIREKKILEKKIGTKDVLYQDKKGGVLKTKMSEVDNYYGIKTTIFEKIECVNELGILNYIELNRKRKRTQKLGIKNYVNFTNELPTIEYFFGRVEELRTMRRWIGAKKPKFIIIYGFAGIGKTTLAVELMNNYIGKKNTFWRQIHDWTALRDILQSLSEFLFQMDKYMLKNYLDSHKTIKENEVKHILEEELREVEALIVLDDCQKASEKIINCLSILKEIIKKTNKISVILLSRKELPIYDIREVEKDKLVAEMQLGDLDDDSAIKFLRARNIDESKITEIFDITKGYPLALNFIQVPKIKKLDKKLILASVNKFLYNQILSKLKRDEKKLLKALSVYRNPISHKALLFEETIKYKTLENLVEKSILKETISDKYTIHDLIRDFIYDQLGPIERKKYHTLAAEFYANIDDDFSLRESMYHYLKAEKFGIVSELLVKNGEILIKKGYCENLNMIFEEFKIKNIPKKYFANILLIKSKNKTLLGEWDAALNLFKLCVDIEKEPSKIQSEAYQGIGYIWTERGEWKRAIESYDNSLKISEIIEDKEGLAEVYRLLGNIYWKKSEYDESQKHLEKSLEFVTEIENTMQIGKIYVDLGMLQAHKNNHDKAQEYFKKSLKLLENSDCVLDIGRALNCLGASYFSLLNYQKAIEQFEKCIVNCKNSGNIETIGYGQLNLCGCYIERGDLKRAIKYCNQALSIFEKLKNRRMIASSYLEFGKIYRLQKNLDKSIEFLMKSLEMFENLYLPFYLARNNYEVGLLYRDMGEEKKAKEFFNRGLQIAKENKVTIYFERINSQIQMSLDK